MGWVLKQEKRCSLCGRSILTHRMTKHQESQACQLRAKIKFMGREGFFPVRRQTLPILRDFNVPYVECCYGSTTKEMPYVWVRGWLGNICRFLKSRALRWVLQELHDNPTFKDSIESVVLLTEGNSGAPLKYAEEQWRMRKGKHKNKDVEARRKVIRALVLNP